MELDETKIYRGSRGKESYSRMGGMGKKRSLREFEGEGGYRQQRGRYKRGQYDDEGEENEYDLDEEEYGNEETAQTFRKRGGREEEEPYQVSKYRYRRRFDPRHIEDPDAPGLQGSNYYVKKTP